MRFINHTLVAVVGATVASFVTYQIVARPPVEMPVSAPVTIRLVEPPSDVVTTPAAPDRTAEERDRLALENVELKAQLEVARARLVERDASLMHTYEQLEDLRRPMIIDMLSSTLRAELNSGEVVVTGGYRLPDGRRLYAFAKPSLQEVNGAEVVTIEGRYITLTDEVGKAVGLDNLATNAANTLQHGEVWVPGEDDAVLAQLKGTPGTEVLDYRSLSVEPGRSGIISIGNIQLKVTPTLTKKDGGLGLELRLEQPQPDANAVK